MSQGQELMALALLRAGLLHLSLLTFPCQLLDPALPGKLKLPNALCHIKREVYQQQTHPRASM